VQEQRAQKANRLILRKENSSLMACAAPTSEWTGFQGLQNLPLLRPSYIPWPTDCPLCKPRYGYRPQYFTWLAPLPPPVRPVFLPPMCVAPPNLCTCDALAPAQ